MEEANNKTETITIKRETLWKYSTFVLLAILILGAFLYFNKNSSSGGTGAVVGNAGNEGAQAATGEASVDDDPVLGSKDAPVTIIEFSDYQCPYCGRHFQQTYPQLKKDYIDTGRVKLVFRDFPLDFHEQAQKAAESAECVRAQGGDDAYWKMHDKLFLNQQSLSVENMKKWAKELGYDINSCLDSGKFTSEVQKDLSEGQSAGVQGTPAFFINGKILSGAYPYSEFKKIIDAELG